MTLGTGFMETEELAGTKGKPPGVAAFLLPEKLLCAGCAVETGAVPEAAINDPDAQPDGVRTVLRQQYSGPAQIDPGEKCEECGKFIQVDQVTGVTGDVRDEFKDD